MKFLVEVDGEVYEWDKCAAPECSNGCCYALGSSKCWPHTFGLPSEIMKNGEVVEIKK